MIKYQTLHDGTTHEALPGHTTFNDLDHILRSLECHSNTEICLFVSDLAETLED